MDTYKACLSYRHKISRRLSTLKRVRDKQLCERVVGVRGSMFQHIAFSFLTTISVAGLLHVSWDPIVACLGTNPYTYRVLLSFSLVTSIYFVVGSLFAVMDLTLSPKALRKYKTQVDGVCDRTSSSVMLGIHPWVYDYGFCWRG